MCPSSRILQRQPLLPPPLLLLALLLFRLTAPTRAQGMQRPVIGHGASNPMAELPVLNAKYILDCKELHMVRLRCPLMYMPACISEDPTLVRVRACPHRGLTPRRARRSPIGKSVASNTSTDSSTWRCCGLTITSWRRLTTWTTKFACVRCAWLPPSVP